MVERVRWQLDAWIALPKGSEHEITGGVTLVRLVPEEVRADDGVQLGLWGGQSDADRRASRAIARLTTLTSEAAVTVPVWEGGRLPADRYRWMPATLVDLDQRERAVSTGAGIDGRSGPWPGCLPAPSPATVYDEPMPLDVLDAEGEVVRVSGRGMVSAPPAGVRLLLGSESDGWRRGPIREVRSWAGPWPVDQHWWEPSRHRRLARFQMLVDDERVGEQAHLVVAEHQRWFLLATYD
jgi:protein ImuB